MVKLNLKPSYYHVYTIGTQSVRALFGMAPDTIYLPWSTESRWRGKANPLYVRFGEYGPICASL